MGMTQEQLQTSYPEGSDVDCVVTRVEPFGVFVRLQDAPKVYGFIRPRDWSWSRRIFNITEKVRPGYTLKARITGYSQQKKLELSRRLLLPDPFPGFVERHRVGSVVLGQVTLVAHNDTGVVLMLEDGVEGFIPRSEIPDVGTREEGFGLLAEDWVAGRIIGFQKDQVRLSVRDYLHDRQRKDASHEESQATLRYHPEVGSRLEDMRLSLELAEIAEPEIEPALRERIRRILVVEDSENVSESLAMIFEHFGFVCDTASNTHEALELMAENDYDLLILDVNLPSRATALDTAAEDTTARDAGKSVRPIAGDGGVELIRRLHRDSTSAIVFVLTATAAADWAKILRFEPNSTTCFFQKPTRISRLVEQLTHLVHGREPLDDRHYTAGLDTSGSPEVMARHGETGFTERVDECLAQLKADTQADQACVLAFRPGPHFELVAGEFPALTRDVQQEIDISPISDVIRQRRYLAVVDVTRHERRFKHLLAVHPIASFAGISLQYSDQSEYGLFLFGQTPNQLRRATEEQLRTTALLLGHYIAEARLDQVITENQSLLLTGFLSDSLLHEIKNELQALADYTAVQVMLGKKAKGDLKKLKPPEGLELKRTILGVQSVSKRLDELVVLFRNLAGRPPDETVDLNAAAERLRETLKPFADAHGVALAVDLDGDVPVLEASPKLIDQTLLNVMINGIEQMSTAGTSHKKLTVTTRYREGDPYPVEVTVRDTGRGVHWVNREKIFDLFFTTKVRGTGLGLYISRFFIEQLGGRLVLRRSVMFEGTEFAIELPEQAVS